MQENVIFIVPLQMMNSAGPGDKIRTISVGDKKEIAVEALLCSGLGSISCFGL